ncbi:hypothetical protein C8245_03050 [Paracidovorax avenae]|uniref:hypothetical protein n=1 Tax=Paracidovorax avenae TaxID=80867 RepID=UPI000D20FA4F|nr:hypothetical protein [Paracidovorax avenae]AVS64805.1 hypothetical protein C8245_03050 [Paracidovorax avenae]
MFFFRSFLPAAFQRDELVALALRDALARRRPQALCGLLQSHGRGAVAACLSREPGAVIADALSMLPADQRRAVFLRLSRSARERAERIGGRAFDAFGPSVPAGAWHRARAWWGRRCRRSGTPV